MRVPLLVPVLLFACGTSASEGDAISSHEPEPVAEAGLPVPSKPRDPSPPPGSTRDAGEAGTLPPDAHVACVDAVNAARVELGVPPLVRDVAREPCADQQAKVDAAHGSAHWAYLHGAPSCLEDPVLDRQSECPAWLFPATKAAPDCVAKMLAEGPGGGHYDVLANPAYTRVACGVYEGASLWLALNFY